MASLTDFIHLCQLQDSFGIRGKGNEPKPIFWCEHCNDGTDRVLDQVEPGKVVAFCGVTGGAGGGSGVDIPGDQEIGGDGTWNTCLLVLLWTFESKVGVGCGSIKAPTPEIHSIHRTSCVGEHTLFVVVVVVYYKCYGCRSTLGIKNHASTPPRNRHVPPSSSGGVQMAARVHVVAWLEGDMLVDKAGVSSLYIGFDFRTADSASFHSRAGVEW